MKSRTRPIKIIVPTHLFLSDYHGVEKELLVLDAPPKIILIHIVHNWIQYQTDEMLPVLHYMSNIVDVLEIYAIEDLVRRNQDITREQRYLLLSTIKHMVRNFLREISPSIEQLNLSSHQYSSVKLEWLGSNLVLDVMG